MLASHNGQTSSLSTCLLNFVLQLKNSCGSTTGNWELMQGVAEGLERTLLQVDICLPIMTMTN